MLADGTYDIFVVDATGLGPEEGSGAFRLELTILAGDHKGEVVTVTTQGLRGTEIDLLGLPGTLTVEAGVPVVRIEG